MISWEGYTMGENSRHALSQVGPHNVEYDPETRQRFIVEPQVLNAALELDVKRSPGPLSPHTVTDSNSGGLPPPPRPHGGRGRPHPSSSSSPATSGDHSIASIPNSPLSPPLSNSPETPSPRLSNIFRGEATLFSNIRQSVVDQDDDGLYDAKDDEPPSNANIRPWSPGDHIDIGSQGSLPSSPELAAVPADGSRPGRQKRYLSGLQKITKLAKSRNSFNESGPRGGRRMSDAEVDPRRNAKKGSDDLSSRYRRILDKSVRTAGEVMLFKPSTSVPNSPISSSVVKNIVLGGDRYEERTGSVNMDREGSSRGRFNSSFSGGGASPSATSPAATARASPTPPRVLNSHGRRPSDLSSSGSPPSVSETSHEPPSSFSSGPRISISSTIYPSSSNSQSLDVPRYPAPGSPPMPTIMSTDRNSFIDLASPPHSPPISEFAHIPNTVQQSHSYSSQPRSLHSNDFSIHGRSTSRSNSSPPRSGSAAPKLHLTRLIPPGGSEKPPIPTAPKPDFSRRSQSNNRSPPAPGRRAGVVMNGIASDVDVRLSTAMDTQNVLTPKERAGRIRTTRKLAQVLGQPPGVPSVSQLEAYDVDMHLSNGCMPPLNLSAKRRQHRPAASMSDDVAGSVYDTAGGMLWPPPEGTRYVSLAPRRYSAPLSPDDLSFIAGHKSRASDASSSFDHDVPSEHVPMTGRIAGFRPSRASKGPGSPMSFMDLSDEEASVETPRVSRVRNHPFSPSTASLADVSSDQQADDERRRKREKLAKLHRFLGSRVPPHLVLGPLDEGAPLPPPALSPFNSPRDDEGEIRRIKMRRRRSSSAAEFSRKWSDDIDRLKEELNEHEKAINVRRAVKMEKMFGVAPPQTLYHTRAPVSSPNILLNSRQSSPVLKSPATPPSRFSTPGPSSKLKSKKRPGTGDSSTPLIDNAGFLDVEQSSVYMHYRHSLNSLNDIMDRDNKESLAELHDFLAGEHYMTGEQYDYQFAMSGNAPIPTSPFSDDVTVASPRSERRRSLPSRMSIASFTSEISTIISPTSPENSFQQRRRRAAKLTQFFGVDYRDLMNKILESIEKELEEERGKGTLKPDEVKDLQQKLVSLKTKRNGLSQ